MTFLRKVLPNSIISISLEDVRVNEAQGALTICGEAVADWIANSITVISLDGGSLSVRLDDTLSGRIELSDGMTIAGEVFTELYWTNTGQEGLTAQIHVAWVD
jgi:hypothetical protein